MSADTKAPRYETICGNNHNFVARKPDTKPSAGAMRAASEIDHCVESYCIEFVPSIKELAELIDRETHIAELVEALESILMHESEDDSEGNIVIRFNCAEWMDIELALRRFKEGL